MGCNHAQRVVQPPATPWGKARAGRGWSIRELADRTGINRGDISKFERGRGCPTPDQARRLLAAFDGSILEQADRLASTAHDAIYAEPFDRQAASDAIWQVHSVLRGALGLPRGSQ
jgi:transcriptional regulator with XRE-family HTH domain